jgi:hypothetical protein
MNEFIFSISHFNITNGKRMFLLEYNNLSAIIIIMIHMFITNCTNYLPLNYNLRIIMPKNAMIVISKIVLFCFDILLQFPENTHLRYS